MSNRVRLRAQADQAGAAARDTADLWRKITVDRMRQGERLAMTISDERSPLAAHVFDLIDQPICTCRCMTSTRFSAQPLMLNLSLERRCLMCVPCGDAELLRHKKIWDANPDENNRCDLCQVVTEQGVTLVTSIIGVVLVVAALCAACRADEGEAP